METKHNPTDWRAIERKRYINDNIGQGVVAGLQTVQCHEDWYASVYVWSYVQIDIYHYSNDNHKPSAEEERAVRRAVASALGIANTWTRIFESTSGQFNMIHEDRERWFIPAGAFDPPLSEFDSKVQLRLIINGSNVQDCKIERYTETVTRYRSNCEEPAEVSDVEGK